MADNNSTDGTRTVVDRLARGSEVSLRYVFEPAQGVNYARNRGITASRGDIVAFTDDDVSPAPAWVQAMVVAVNRSRADGVGGRILPRWQVPPPRWLEDRHLWGALAVRDSERPAALKLDGRGRFEGGAEIWGANMAFLKTRVVTAWTREAGFAASLHPGTQTFQCRFHRARFRPGHTIVVGLWMEANRVLDAIKEALLIDIASDRAVFDGPLPGDRPVRAADHGRGGRPTMDRTL